MPLKKSRSHGRKTAPRKKAIRKKAIPPRQSGEVKKDAVPDPVKKKPRAPRKKVTLETHLAKLDSLLKLLDDEIDRKSREKEKGTRTFQRIRKVVREIKRETPKIANAKRRVRVTGNRVSGFMIKYPVNEEGARFLQLDKGTPLSRRELTNAICVYAHRKPDEIRELMLKWDYLNLKGERDLQKPGERMVILPDDTLTKLLRYEEYQKQVKAGKIIKRVKIKETGKTVEKIQTDDSLYYYVVQKLIGHLFDKPVKE